MSLPALLQEYRVESLLDAPCGDYAWIEPVANTVRSYIGIDLVEPLVQQLQERYGDTRRRFVHADVSRDVLPHADAILCRDCLVHLPNEQIVATLANFERSGARYLLATTFTDRVWNARDIALGEWRSLNLEKSPLHLPRPLRVLNEGYGGHRGVYADKSLALWDLDLIRGRPPRDT